MNIEQHLILTGFMGSGKSSVGRELANMLQNPFIDLDEYIEKQTGLTITEIFTRQGEGDFRRLETRFLQEVLHCPPLIVSTGGGTIISEENRRLMQASGYVVFLDASWETLTERTAASCSRPLLQSPEKTATDNRFRQQKIKDLLNARRPFYEKCHVKITTDNLSVHQVARKIIQQITSS
jgi:shikimate kinase